MRQRTASTRPSTTWCMLWPAGSRRDRLPPCPSGATLAMYSVSRPSSGPTLAKPAVSTRSRPRWCVPDPEATFLSSTRSVTVSTGKTAAAVQEGRGAAAEGEQATEVRGPYRAVGPSDQPLPATGRRRLRTRPRRWRCPGSGAHWVRPRLVRAGEGRKPPRTAGRWRPLDRRRPSLARRPKGCPWSRQVALPRPRSGCSRSSDRGHDS